MGQWYLKNNNKIIKIERLKIGTHVKSWLKNKNTQNSKQITLMFYNVIKNSPTLVFLVIHFQVFIVGSYKVGVCTGPRTALFQRRSSQKQLWSCSFDLACISVEPWQWEWQNKIYMAFIQSILIIFYVILNLNVKMPHIARSHHYWYISSNN